MKKHLCLIALVVSLAAPAVIKADEGGHEDTPLGAAMEKMNSPFRKLRRQAADPAQNEASLALVEKLAKATKEAAALLPEKISKLPADKQEAAKASYSEKMKELLATIDELGAALKAGKNEDAVKIIEKLRSQQEDGHREFRPKKQKTDARAQ
jgi:molecular chaperone GrpE (heat shock protein)